VKLKSAFACLFIGTTLLILPVARSQQSAEGPDRRHFTDEDRTSMRAWYVLHRSELPVGVRRQDRLPGDMEKQLVIHEVLSEDLRARVHAVSADFLGRVPPVPEGCEYVFIGGHAVLLDAKSYEVYDVYHFEKKP
jgi:hypothetical protein